MMSFPVLPAASVKSSPEGSESEPPVQFNDLAAQQDRVRPQLERNIHRVLHHGKYILGPEIQDLEEKLREYVGVKHAITCSSGTDALLMALMAYGVGPGDAIFTTPFTFIATAEVVSLLGATPVFADVDPDTFNLDPTKLKEAIKQTKAAGKLTPKGVIGVDIFGLPADYDAINDTAKASDLFVIEDAAQSFGGSYKGRPAGGLAEIGTTSFFPAKPLGGYGDGGAIFTDDDETAEILRSIRFHGKGRDKYDSVRVGLNGRIDTLQAAIVSPKLDLFDKEVKATARVAERYRKGLPKSIRAKKHRSNTGLHGHNTLS